MDLSSQNKTLLPAGFEDLLPPEAEQEYQAISTLMAGFTKFGYGRVKPPLAEFEESLLAPGPGAALSPVTFRVMDPVSHRMMGLRSDITAQIARIALSRLSEQERPLRLTYANDVIRTKATQQRTQRQFTQVGCEMIGQDDAHSDIEMCVVALKGLADIGFEAVTLDFSLPRIAGEIIEAAGGADLEVLRHELTGPLDKVLPALDRFVLSEEALSFVQRLRAVVDGVQEALDSLGLCGVSLSVDLLETRGFEYHEGVAFTFFAQDVHGELGRGGRYMLYDGAGDSENACGFTFYMDTIRQGLKCDIDVKRKIVSVDTGWAEILNLQDQGYVVIKSKDKES